MEPAVEQTEDQDAEKSCQLSPWFYRRMGMLTALVAGLGLYFLYDGAIGYPKKNFKVDLYEAFEAGSSGSPVPEISPDAKPLSAEQKQELEKANEAGREGGTWAGFAAERLMPEKVPERYTAGDIREQFVCAAAMGFLVVVIGVFILWQRGRVIRYGSGEFTVPGGETIPYDQVSKIDLEKWDRGVGRVFYRTEEEGESSVKVDDYKYAGCGAMLKEIVDSNDEILIVGDERWLSPENTEGADKVTTEESTE